MLKHNAALMAAFLAALVCAAHGASAQSANHRPGQVPVAAHDLMRGAVLSSADIEWADTTLTDGSIPTAAIGVAPGWVAHRVIRAGEVLREPGVEKPDLVSAGDAVDVIYARPGVVVRVRGTAVGRGGKGDEVYVRLGNRQRLRGIIDGPNTVRVM